MHESDFPPRDENSIKKDLLDTLNQLETLQEQNINLFDQPQVNERVLQLIQLLEYKIKELQPFFQSPTPDQNRILQDLLFNTKKLKDTLEDLKLQPQKVDFQHQFIDAVDEIFHCVFELLE